MRRDRVVRVIALLLTRSIDSSQNSCNIIFSCFYSVLMLSAFSEIFLREFFRSFESEKCFVRVNFKVWDFNSFQSFYEKWSQKLIQIFKKPLKSLKKTLKDFNESLALNRFYLFCYEENMNHVSGNFWFAYAS